ncbi:hypothetical protein BDV25DRAFT_18888 [Aspergillus avenaceus]|uniref:Uncharacterized protein n=1 Tax=Aspergillus avenaceus TaxID=36643 RepID=A0A5N6TQI2_ASPAV|nr:hypothetical protein BDV25DRAFT_18888 [Aspergillus avenaceus]
MSYQSGSQGSAPRVKWQDQLASVCRVNKWPAPTYNIVSDRRGGRTAWSSYVTLPGRQLQGRYWYDGAYIDNAKEDAAEVAMIFINRAQSQQSKSSPPFPGSIERTDSTRR